LIDQLGERRYRNVSGCCGDRMKLCRITAHLEVDLLAATRIVRAMRID
jgi:hypothetical protein